MAAPVADEQLDAASDAGLLFDQSELVEGLEHLVTDGG